MDFVKLKDSLRATKSAVRSFDEKEEKVEWGGGGVRGRGGGAAPDLCASQSSVRGHCQAISRFRRRL